MKKIVFIIPSVTYFKDKPLSYSNIRSIFPPSQRAIQTKQTIKSIRNKVLTAKIIFIEMGLKNTEDNYGDIVDKYIYLGKNKVVRFFCDGKFKGAGEAIGLIVSRREIEKMDGDFYFKISGRYFLNENFNLNHWEPMTKFIFCKNKKSISTRLYGFPKKLFNVWISSLMKSLFLLIFNISIEIVMPIWIPIKNIKNIEKLGVSGTIAPTGDIIEE